MECTWAGCQEPATQTQLDKTGKPWAHLCQNHHDQLNASIDGMNPRMLMSSWVLAQGGAALAAESMRRNFK
jgi:hypothetical protein